MPRVVRASLLTLLATALCVLGVAPVASAADRSAGTGLLRLMHLSPDTPSVDVAIDSVTDPGVGVVLSGVGYGDVSPYQSVPAGTYTVSVRAAGADPSTPPVLATTVTVAAGTATTVAGAGAFADLAFAVVPDDLTLPPGGQARARVVDASMSGSPVDLTLAGGPSLATDLGFTGHTGYVDVPSGPGTLTVTPATGSPTDVPVDLAAGSVSTVLVLDRDGGGVEIRTVLDAASPGTVPVGGVEAGAGGTATGAGPGAGPLAPAALARALALATALVPLRARVPRRRGTRYAARGAAVLR
jgi:Domain of unknown function (DUF4397)